MYAYKPYQTRTREEDNSREELAVLRRREQHGEGNVAEENLMEREADNAANSIVHGDGINADNLSSIGVGLQRKAEEQATKLKNNISVLLQSSKGGGQQLDNSIKGEMEGKMNTDLSDVRIHDDAQAHQMSENINAKVFTHGKDIYFKEGNYNPNIDEGKELLAHELAHTQQVNGANEKLLQRKGDEPGHIPIVTGNINPYIIVEVDANGDQYPDLQLYISKEEKNIKINIYHLETKQWSGYKIFDQVEFDYSNVKLKNAKLSTRQIEEYSPLISSFTFYDGDLENGDDTIEEVVLEITSSKNPEIDGKYYVRIGDQTMAYMFNPQKIISHGETYFLKDKNNQTNPKIQLTFGDHMDSFVLQLHTLSESPYRITQEKLDKLNEKERPSDKPNDLFLNVFMQHDATTVKYGPLVIRTSINGDTFSSADFNVISKNKHEIELDIDGDGKPDIWAYSYVTPLEVNQTTPTWLDRNVYLFLKGDSIPIENGYKMKFVFKNGVLTYSRKMDSVEEYRSMADLKSKEILDSQHILENLTEKVDELNAYLDYLRAKAASEGIINQDTYNAWRELSFGVIQLNTLIGKTNKLQSDIASKSIYKSVSERTALFYNKLKKETKSEWKTVTVTAYGDNPEYSWIENPYTGERIHEEEKTLKRYHVDDPIVKVKEEKYNQIEIEQYLQDKNWSAYNASFTNLADRYLKWLIHKSKKNSNPESEVNVEEIENVIKYRNELSRIKDKKFVQQVPAVFFPDDNASQLKEKGIDQLYVPLQLFCWVEGNEWVIEDLIKLDKPFKTSVPFEQSDSNNDITKPIPPRELFLALNHEKHLPKGILYYTLPDGSIDSVKTEGEVTDWYDILSYIGLGLAAVGIGLVTFGTGTVAVLGTYVLVGSTVATAISAAGAMADDYQHGQLTPTSFMLYTAEILTAFLQVKVATLGRVLDKTSKLSKLTGLTGYAQKVYIPLRTTALATEGFQVAVIAYDTATQISAIANGPGSDNDKKRTIFILITQATVSGGFFIMDLRGSPKEINDFNNKKEMIISEENGIPIVKSSSSDNIHLDVNATPDVAENITRKLNIEGVDNDIRDRMHFTLGKDQFNRVDNIVETNSKKLRSELDEYGTEAVYHALNLSNGDISRAKKILKQSGGDYAEMHAIQKQQTSIEDVESGKTKLKGYGEKPKDQTRPGNYGEMKMDKHFEGLTEINGQPVKLKRISKDRITDIDQKGHSGIDGVYENLMYPPPPKYIIAESKYGKSPLSKDAKDGPQMSDDWIKGSNRLEKAIGDDAREVKKALDRGEVERVLSKVDETGNVTTFAIDETGKVIGTWP